jgi:hypothetical protein
MRKKRPKSFRKEKILAFKAKKKHSTTVFPFQRNNVGNAIHCLWEFRGIILPAPRTI